MPLSIEKLWEKVNFPFEFIFLQYVHCTNVTVLSIGIKIKSSFMNHKLYLTSITCLSYEHGSLYLFSVKRTPALTQSSPINIYRIVNQTHIVFNINEIKRWKKTLNLSLGDWSFNSWLFWISFYRIDRFKIHIVGCRLNNCNIICRFLLHFPDDCNAMWFTPISNRKPRRKAMSTWTLW